MQDYIYSVIGFIAIAIQLIINAKVMFNKEHIATQKVGRKYRLLMLSIFAYYITDALWGMLAGLEWTPLLFLDTTVYFVAMSAAVVCYYRYFVEYLEMNNWHGKMFNAFGTAFFFLQIFCLILNFFVPCFFWFDETGAYVTGTIRTVSLWVQIAMFAFSSIITFAEALKYQGTEKNRHLAISFFSFIMLVAVIFQEKFPLLPVYALGCLLGSCVLHVYVVGDEQEQYAAQLMYYKQANLSDALISLEANLTKDELFYGVWKDDDGKEVPLKDIIGMEVPCSYDQYVKTWRDTFVKNDFGSSFSGKTDREYLLESYENGITEVTFDYEAETITGRIAWLRRDISITRNTSGDVIAFSNVKDVSEIVAEQERARKELEEAKYAAEAASRAKTSFLFNMSHDIRTPMNAILGYTDIAIKHRNDADRVDESLEKIQVAGRHLLNLINDILEMSRIESGKLEISEEPMDFRKIAENAAEMSKSLAVAKSIDFQTEISDFTDPYVYSDELHANEVLINLLSNAIKYTPTGGKVRFYARQLGAAKDGVATYRFEVTDNGIGMSEEFQKHLFEAFSREKTSTVSKQEGAGLGLSIVKKIVDLAGGTITAKSRLNEGTTFTVEVPCRVMDAEAIRKFVEENTPIVLEENYSFDGRKVLLVEDNEMNREIATDILEETGLSVDTAEDGVFAVKAITEKGTDYYDFVLMDIQMPVMNGYEATKAIRALPGGDKVTIIALSANAFEEDIKKSLDSGMNAHVAKPIDVKALLETMQGLAL